MGSSCFQYLKVIFCIKGCLLVDFLFLSIEELLEVFYPEMQFHSLHRRFLRGLLSLNTLGKSSVQKTFVKVFYSELSPNTQAVEITHSTEERTIRRGPSMGRRYFDSLLYEKELS